MYIEFIEPVIKKALLDIGVESNQDIVLEIPKESGHGDLSTNIAMKLARELKKAPKVIAEELVFKLDYDKNFIENIQIAGSGFINFTFSKYFYSKIISDLHALGADFGKNNTGKNLKANVEYVSVNPTGLLHLGHGRNASIGDTIANLLEWSGYEVTREYYFNNAGNQMNMLAKSIHARYRQQLGESDYIFPTEGYHGDYIREIAQDLVSQKSDSIKEDNEENLFICRKFGEEWCFNKIKKTLIRMNIHQDIYYNEDSLYSDGKIQDVLDIFKNLGLSYEKEGAVWLSLSQMGLKDDRVIVKSTGEPTYRLPDIAYHREKFRRGYDLLVDIFGADHIATVPDVMAGVKALGYDNNKVKVIVHQFVTLTEAGEQVKMSKRSGKVYTLDDLLDEVGPDVVRFFLLMRGVGTHLEFDLAVAREQSDKNPVFYLQYAHARICSIFDTAEQRGIKLSQEADFKLLIESEEIDLIKDLMNFPKIIVRATEKFEPQILAEYLRQLAASFHIFYHNCRILGSPDNLLQTRLNLVKVVKTAMKNGLDILGISAPERM